ncbi:hypothetical protein BD626DRAFT_579778 [Schizophyllum amplum]|uniref:Uncharacterized protein n=1 Tax=Schizophyllum amplum TaxID=97359 RepID=A0A550CWH8_9AGAR|nr:hypothetical protein BD626DRAFT_579778 [Auriculariopsis ampla]
MSDTQHEPSTSVLFTAPGQDSHHGAPGQEDSSATATSATEAKGKAPVAFTLGDFTLLCDGDLSDDDAPRSRPASTPSDVGSASDSSSILSIEEVMRELGLWTENDGKASPTGVEGRTTPSATEDNDNLGESENHDGCQHSDELAAASSGVGLTFEVEKPTLGFSTEEVDALFDKFREAKQRRLQEAAAHVDQLHADCKPSDE